MNLSKFSPSRCCHLWFCWCYSFFSLRFSLLLRLLTATQIGKTNIKRKSYCSLFPKFDSIMYFSLFIFLSLYHFTSYMRTVLRLSLRDRKSEWESETRGRRRERARSSRTGFHSMKMYLLIIIINSNVFVQQLFSCHCGVFHAILFFLVMPYMKDVLRHEHINNNANVARFHTKQAVIIIIVIIIFRVCVCVCLLKSHGKSS